MALDKAVVAAIALGAYAVLFALYRHADAQRAEYKAALESQAALLRETQEELRLRDAAIARRDEQFAALEKKTAQKDKAYAKLLRDKKDVRDWDAVPLPDDVRGMLRQGAGHPADASGGADGGGGNP